MGGKGGGVPLPPGGKFEKKPGSAARANSGGGAPSQIMCSICKKPKNREEFSKRQLLKFSTYGNGGRTFNKNPSSVHVTCTTCTAGQTCELKCCVCDKIKGLDKFAKNQRKDPDNARCINCVNYDINVDPDLSPGNEDERDSTDDDDDEHNWDTKTRNPPTNNVNSFQRPNPKGTSWAQSSSAGGDNDYDYEDEYEDATSISGSQSAAFQPRASQAPSTTSGRYDAAEEEDDQWETVASGPSKPAANGSVAGSYRSGSGYGSPASRPAVRKNGWAKTSKSANAGWEDDELWANYGKGKKK